MLLFSFKHRPGPGPEPEPNSSSINADVDNGFKHLKPNVTTRLYDTAVGSQGLLQARIDLVCFQGRLNPNLRPTLSFLMPKIQGPSQRELFLLYAEVEALQTTLGIGYKDAAHRLFMAEVERVQKADSAAKAFGALRRCMDDILSEEIFPPISAIDKGEFDNYIFKDGKWEMKSDRGGLGKGV